MTAMNNFLKCLISIVLVLVLCIGSAACGSGSDEGQKNAVDENAEAAAADPEEPSGSDDFENAPEPEGDPEYDNNGETDITRALIARAAEMQDYSHPPGEDAPPISSVDDNILLLVNKTHPLSRDYAADDMVTVDRTVDGVGTAETHMMRKAAADAMNRLIDGAEQAGYSIKLRTAYRSYDYQDTLFNSYASKHGEEEANKFSARPGESEHQTGMCADVSSPSVSYGLSYSYGETEEGKWLSEHAHEYGYIIRYLKDKEDITGYVYEPWHIRYVGTDAAAEIYEKGICLEEYLGILD